LPRAEQVELLEELICLVGIDEADVSLTPAQQEDLDRRTEEYRSGKAKVLPGDEVFARLRNRS
jgi:putative addiction module component (TIGR02574 family)